MLLLLVVLIWFTIYSEYQHPNMFLILYTDFVV